MRVEPSEKVTNESHELRGGSKEASQGQEEEQDPEVLARREKQLDTFKRSIDYRFVTPTLNFT